MTGHDEPADHVDHVDRVVEQWRRERPDLDVSPQAVFGRLHRLADELRAILVAGYAEHGLGEAEFDVLATLRRSGPPYELAPVAIAQLTMVTSGAATKRLERLEAAGYIEKRPNADDGRGKVVKLTDAGRAVIDAAYTAHIEREHHLLASLSPRQQDQLSSLLRTWADGLQRSERHGGERG
jgi:DNA-binding MarR family transcriptional regulator